MTPFVAGKRYVTRSGAIFLLERINPDKVWPFLVGQIEDGGVTIALCPDGKRFPHEDEDGLDLVSEAPA